MQSRTTTTMASVFLSISSVSLALSLCYALLVSSLQSSFSSSHDITNESSLSYLPMSDPLLQSFLDQSGYIALADRSARMFYYFFDKRSKDDSPIMLWLTGVPGTTCNIALFRENGPFRIKQDFSLEPNEYGWDKEFKMIYVDEPRGTGFSYINSDSDIRDNEDDIVDDLYNFLEIFFYNHHELRDNHFYITGQSHAGKYALALANRIRLKSFINLKGVAIGNGFTNPKKQFSTTLQYSYQKGLVEDKDQETITTLSELCMSSADSCDVRLDQSVCEAAYDICGHFIHKIAKSKGRNVYDTRKPYFPGDLHYNFSNVHDLLNQESVKRHLGVGIKSFELLNRKVHRAMKGYYMKNAENDVLSLLDGGTNILIYAGEDDMLCNAFGNLKWVKELVWRGNTYLLDKELKYVSFMLNGAEVGRWRLYKHFTFLSVKNAGHMVGMDQPEVAFEMIKKWTLYAIGLPL